MFIGDKYLEFISIIEILGRFVCRRLLLDVCLVPRMTGWCLCLRTVYAYHAHLHRRVRCNQAEAEEKILENFENLKMMFSIVLLWLEFLCISPQHFNNLEVMALC